mmetsp:Transcript_22863/g.25440  ORF Transcript_22863/g.25440 Transcript_22863/m.25440 type:complete len:197 (+) Transcript_22863:265-855(+)
MLRQSMGGRQKQQKEAPVVAPSVTDFLKENKQKTKLSMLALDEQIKLAGTPEGEGLDPIEDILEKARQKCRGGRPVTRETFMQWKEKIKKLEEADKLAVDKERAKMLKSGKVKMTGKELFTNKKELAFEDNDTADGDVMDLTAFKKEEEEEQIGDPLDQVPVEILQKILENVNTKLFDTTDPILNQEIVLQVKVGA